ncbi:hypothetical protein ACMHYB_02110 [Sorangium sp. So ce1128]
MPFNEITNLRIVSVPGAGDLSSERVVLRVMKACNLMHYLIVDATDNGNGTFSNKNSRVYWFPEQIVSPTDYVVLFTKFGLDRTYINKQGFTVHVFYWGMPDAVWGEYSDGVVLVSTARAAFKPVHE